MINFEKYKKEILEISENNPHNPIRHTLGQLGVTVYEGSNELNFIKWGLTDTGDTPNTHDDFKRRLVEAGRLISETCRQHDSCYTCPLRNPGKKKSCAFEAPPEYILFDVREEPWSAVVPTEEDNEDES